MAVPTASRPRAATLLGTVVVGVALAALLHHTVPVVPGGPLHELQHLAVAPLLAVLLLVGAPRWAPGAGRRLLDPDAILTVVLLAAAGHEALEIAGDLLAQHGGAFEHLTHGVPPALALLVPAVAAATGLSCVLVLAASRVDAPACGAHGAGPVAGPRGTPGDDRRPQPPRSGRTAGRAPPRTLPA